MCHNKPSWTRISSTILVSLQSYVRTNAQVSRADNVYGTALRISSEYFLEEDFQNINYQKPDKNYNLAVIKYTLHG